MTTTGTYTFNPSLGEITLYAFQRIGIRSAELTAEHMQSARMAANFLLVDWANDGPSLWKVDLVTDTLVQGTATYPVDPSTIVMLDAYVTQTFGINGTTDRIILPISRSEYASYPNKDEQGVPSVFWYDRLVSPNYTLWQVPGASTTAATLSYYRVVQMQDADFPGGLNVDLVYRFLSAFAEGMALKLAGVWNPAREQAVAPAYAYAYKLARKQDVESAALYITPNLSRYWRI